MERKNINIKTGLNNAEVSQRIAQNLINYNDVPPTKTIKQIIIRLNLLFFFMTNILTTFIITKILKIITKLV